ncbi:MAG: septum formation protein Maf [Alphaproteobacteria bacterium]|nr:septum formation protein Maf [Alphaproteobacteria bacterium]PPR14066.1 MAG: Septum formation protein Maf [Alphaproteobacteria bacterium MarineAlpha12_Bin1]|tara:strand:+ start:5867 stop:6487 length:621 start_codon:yes stop_codon:yes gene_type:complete
MTSEQIQSHSSVILASKSKIRTRLLNSAGVKHTVFSSEIDESEIKFRLKKEKVVPGRIASILAEKKAEKISLLHPNSLVVGVDQILDCEGVIFDKPKNLDEARNHLMVLRGRNHKLLVSVCLAQYGIKIWSYESEATLEMRHLSDDYIDWYIRNMGEEACQTVGAYKIEGLGAQLFSKIEGDYFSILGIPLLSLLTELRQHGVILK